MLKVIVGTNSEMKVDAVREILESILTKQKISFQIKKLDVSSSVSPQPYSLLETKKGAFNRVNNINEESDFYVGIESGAFLESDGLYNITYCVVSNKDKSNYGIGSSSTFFIPESIASEINIEKEMINCNYKSKLKRGPDGLIASLTGGYKKRRDLVKEAFISALLPMNFFGCDIPNDSPKECLKYINDPSVSFFDKNELAQQLVNLDLKPITKIFKPNTNQKLDVVPVLNYNEKEKESVYNIGVDCIRQGKVGVCIMCGGQGSRLGTLRPKGLLELEIPSHPTLLELNLKRIKKLISLCTTPGNPPPVIPVFIMTSDQTHSEINAYLVRNEYFGLPFVRLMKQQSLPARLENGEIAMRTKGKILASPNGNGSIFETIRNSGALGVLKQNGVKFLEIHAIDNALIKPADPYFIGAAERTNSDVCLKVLRKIDPSERVGTCVNINGKTSIIEYSEIPKDESSKHMYGNICIQIYSVDIIERICNIELPYHIANKNELAVNAKGQIEKLPVVKYERFIFDGMEYSNKTTLLECQRDEEFAPIKNSTDVSTDNINTATELLLNLYKKWAEKAGINIKGDKVFEIPPEVSYGGEGLERYKGSTLSTLHNEQV